MDILYNYMSIVVISLLQVCQNEAILGGGGVVELLDYIKVEWINITKELYVFRIDKPKCELIMQQLSYLHLKVNTSQ